ncbi:ParB/RepB/Spo0J family partition protein [Salisediminibacterium halotolerans]|uniref:ParB/RepB/Spo0J family partition protein n=1 Tax=Salisediminibacterium halotolerans TaxID=517425 RepID=UPI000EABC888|nr:ParB/RepB/Spo0J family partition protein [Salisediminibacterium halotolerans]RLJ75712.1 hypothetical protein BCL39_1230 [Actinophytocola xinjiangensis]RPE89566.1 hypothetical protein EDD67_0343 [Salisediminibacterium halotolerans]TWG36325.1 hypothetical protein BCL52_1227 [Salisediminibacterium halotolerans]GEL07227.1 hypothetical protein SHA02_06430 [Salisediminibacterium halotolerans]
MQIKVFSILRVISKRFSTTYLVNKIFDFYYKCKFAKLAPKNKVLWVEPNTIKYILNNEKNKKWSFGNIMNGDWDLDKKLRYELKYKSLVQRFIYDYEWPDTDIFKNYEKRLKDEEEVLGCKSIDQLEERYEEKIDKLYFEIKKNGFLNPNEDNKVDPIYIYIDRYGELIYSDNGNHRLAIAKILKIDKIPVLVHSRHKEWQEIRERIYKDNKNDKTEFINLYYNHPDVQDILEN